MTSTLYRSGSIYAPGTPRATALLTDSTTGEVVWVGTDEAAARLGEPDVEVDLRGGLLAPAFVDAWVDEKAAARAARDATTLGIGSVHVLARSGAPSSCERTRLPGAPELVTYGGVLSGDLDPGGLRDRYVEDTTAGRQTVLVLDSARALPGVLSAAAAAADELGVARFVAARHRLHDVGVISSATVAELARLGILVCLVPSSAAAGSLPLRELAGAGVPLALGSAAPETAPAPWEAVRAASSPRLGDSAVSVRAAFVAATRGGRRAAGQDGAGELRPGAPATFAIWRFEGELVVRTPDARVAAWSTDPRAATPGLPDLADQGPLPRCRRTVVDGRVVFDAGSAG